MGDDDKKGTVRMKPMTDEEMRQLLKYMGDGDDEGMDSFFENLLIEAYWKWKRSSGYIKY